MATGWSVLDALNRESRAEVEERPKARFRTKDISIKRIYANEKNFYSMTGIEALAGEILAAGLIENLTVTYAPCDKGEYRLIAGERRYRALKLLVDQGYTEFETATCQIKAPAEEHEETVQLILANGYREKTVADVLEEEKRLKEALQYMRDNGLKLAGYELDSGRLRDVIAGMMNTSPTRIAQIESINKNLLPEMRRAVDEGRLTFSAAYEVSGMDETGQRQMLEKFRDQGALSIADVRAAKAAQAAALEAAQAAPDAGDGLEHTPAAQGNTAAQDGPERAAQDAGEDYIDPAPERVLSICYKCARYTLCNEKRSDVRACNAYLDKAERDKTPEQRYAEEQAAIDRETARAMKERAREDRLDKALNQKPEKTVIVGVTELNEIMRGEKLFLLLKNDGYAKGQEITLTGYDHGKPANTGLKVRVMYLLEDYKGLEDGYCILQISVTGITAAQDAPDAGDGLEHTPAAQGAQEAQAEAQAAQDAITDALDDMDALERAGHE